MPESSVIVFRVVGVCLGALRVGVSCVVSLGKDPPLGEVSAACGGVSHIHHSQYISTMDSREESGLRDAEGLSSLSRPAHDN